MAGAWQLLPKQNGEIAELYFGDVLATDFPPALSSLVG